ncbi:MAG: nucleotidyltransferase [Ignavibacteria bacterium GWB2_35_12]|nr:MAG: nucleotidyltransferase [Ignavibacteria bacterium GWA2_35_8]OGU42450.1 MAG: nucleotidyltransferase [Ignavibacteria bacterium GWB2_35_12]OGU96619.1 MAG: nucleotidyltransferase [Ignavibacteria bacterium RIFOXYA2_FULL_35_10]OGV24230.1 MAG: nucleotidyltransferase [Ignavibacteria bacterium RIFOXYC2_FULL_35_21]
MAEIPDNVKNIIEKLISKLEINQIRIDKAILFGSYAEGKYDEWSDIDLALVSKDFSGSRFYDNLKVLDAALDIDSGISPMTYLPDDFTPDNLFVRDILRKGIQIR